MTVKLRLIKLSRLILWYSVPLLGEPSFSSGLVSIVSSSLELSFIALVLVVSSSSLCLASSPSFLRKSAILVDYDKLGNRTYTPLCVFEEFEDRVSSHLWETFVWFFRVLLQHDVFSFFVEEFPH